MKTGFRYTAFDRIFFFLSYLWYKVLIPFEMRKNRLGFWLYEFRYTMAKFRKYDTSPAYHGPGDVISTRFGEFKVRLGTSDASTVSPAFERLDINRLRTLIARLLSENKRVLFLDIGGDIGAYSIMVANSFADAGNRLSIACFEPIDESRVLIEENCRRNTCAERVRIFPYALLDTDDTDAVIKLVVSAPGSSAIGGEVAGEIREIKVHCKRLDSLMAREIRDYDAVIMKIDVEGVEQEVLSGAPALLSSGKEIHLMVEDFIKPSIIAYLEATGWTFCKKLTDYNSWWRK